MQSALKILALAFAAYVGAYFLTVDAWFTPIQGARCTPSYRVLGRSLDGTLIPTLFRPIQRLDARVRPRFWVFHNEQPAQWKEGRLKHRTDKVLGVSEEDAHKIVAGLKTR